MAIPWLVVLSNIPWREVIVNAPKVADEAKKLWTNLNDPDAKNKPAARQAAKKPMYENDGYAVDPMTHKIASLEHSVADLHQQMVESSMLIKALADQNEQLVKHIEINRSRLKLMLIVLIVFMIVAAVAFYQFKIVG